MEEQVRTYIAIDLKSFYASVECVERGLDPLAANLVVADPSRTEKTICLAVSPVLKSYGIAGRPRLFEVEQKVQEINAERLTHVPGQMFKGSSVCSVDLDRYPELKLDYIVAMPRMALYIEYSAKIYEIYLKYIAPEDMHVYSIDEIFLDVTQYLNTYQLSARKLAARMVQDVFRTTGITATAGIGSNLYLCKVAMDIVAKHIPSDQYGVRIAKLDEKMYRKLLWNHQPITDFWRIGKGYEKKLAEHGMYTMGDVARCSVGKADEYHNEELLYRLFGVQAELLIDHAWGWEPCTMEDIKAYKPSVNSLGSGQVLQCPYCFEKGRLIVKEMADLLILKLVDKQLVTKQIVLTVGYDLENMCHSETGFSYSGEIYIDHYGRKVPKHARGTVNFETATSSTRKIMQAVLKLYDEKVNPSLTIRRVYLSANYVIPEKCLKEEVKYEQLDLFTDYEKEFQKQQQVKIEQKKERSLQKARLEIQKKYGKNAILRGMNLLEGAMTRERNEQIGGHRA